MLVFHLDSETVSKIALALQRIFQTGSSDQFHTAKGDKKIEVIDLPMLRVLRGKRCVKLNQSSKAMQSLINVSIV